MCSSKAIDAAVAEYYRTLCGEPGPELEEILCALPEELHEEFLADVAKLDFIWAVTAPLREQRRAWSPPGSLTHN